MPLIGLLVSILIICSNLIYVPGVKASTHAETLPVKKANASKNDNALYQQAVQLDLNGQHMLARKHYDALKNREIVKLSAVPSAINHAALNNYQLAQKAFSALEKSTDTRDREYAQLWTLWLTARQWNGSKNDLIKQNKRYVESHSWNLPWEKLIAQMYTNEVSPEALMVLVNSGNIPIKIKNDALTESLFFATGYLKYVEGNSIQATMLFNKYKSFINATSLESQLLFRQHAY